MTLYQHCRFGVVLPLLAVLASAGSLRAELIATNGNITAATLNTAGGMVSDPKVCIYDAFNKDWAAAVIIVGSTQPWNMMIVTNGSVVTTTAANNYIGGDTAGADHNRVLVTGPGTALSYGGEVRIGSRGSYNNLTLRDSASTTMGGVLHMGRQDLPTQGSYNTIVVDDATLSVAGKIVVGYASNNVNNAVSIRNGGVFRSKGTGGNGLSIGRYGSYADVTVSDLGSVLAITGNLRLGETTTLGAHHNTLTLQDGGIAQLTNATATITLSTMPAHGGTYIRFAAGFLAWNGNHTSGLNVLTQVQLWDGTAFVVPADAPAAAALGWSVTLYTADAAGEAAALAATGYSGLGGFTVFTGGDAMNPPPPSTTVLILR